MHVTAVILLEMPRSQKIYGFVLIGYFLQSHA